MMKGRYHHIKIQWKTNNINSSIRVALLFIHFFRDMIIMEDMRLIY